MAIKEVEDVSRPETARPLAPIWDMEKWFDEVFRRPFSLAGLPGLRLQESMEIMPAVDIFEENGDVVVKAEIPGIAKDDIDITIADNVLTLSGEKKKEGEVKKKDYYQWECSYGSFSRSFNLLADVQTDKVTSKLRDGVLEIRIPKTEEARKKKIKVKVE